MIDAIEIPTAHPYICWIGHGAYRHLTDYLDGVEKVCLITSDNLIPHAQKIIDFLSHEVDIFPVIVSQGEKAKTPAETMKCWSQLAQAMMTRSDAIIGLGGGATTDFAGFIASTYMRGIRYISMPTTVLAMVDAAVGGKTGIDLPEGKNLVGSFYEPKTVIMDFSFLDGLERREIISGFAEVIKTGFIGEESILLSLKEDLKATLDITSDRFRKVVTAAVKFKGSVVSCDLHESTSVGEAIGREMLNYGHTLGHAIETLEGGSLRHGEAVSIGMVYAATLSSHYGLSDDLLCLHRDILESVGLPISSPPHRWEEVRTLMARDKKSRGHHLRFVALRDIGHPYILDSADEEILGQCYRTLCL